MLKAARPRQTLAECLNIRRAPSGVLETNESLRVIKHTGVLVLDATDSESSVHTSRTQLILTHSHHCAAFRLHKGLATTDESNQTTELEESILTYGFHRASATVFV